ncbi:MAG: CotH kinase family protein [Defluviitaleaceae bacterium]|nr:CotH kinase family protein [Defluviitaleaceae bacterium]
MKLRFFITTLILVLGILFVPVVLIAADLVSFTVKSTETLEKSYDTGIFPSLHMTTYYNPFTAEREFWHNGIISITGAQEGQNFEAADARIRGRGNSTWQQGIDKRPLRFRFNEAQPMLGSAYAATDWILLADFFDRSLMRNHAALYLGNLMSGLSFTPIPRPVNLYVNGEYMGVYLLTDERDVNPGRMQLEWNEDPALSDFFFELDARASQGGVLGDTFIRVNGLSYDIRFPGSSRRTPGHVTYLSEYIHAVSDAVRSQNFEDILQLIDLDSFVDFYIVQELFKDVDAANQLSIFLHIQGQGQDRRLFMGPLWDFDIAAGNVLNQPLGRGPEDLFLAVFNYWYRYLMLMPEFHDAVAIRWNQVADNEIAQMLSHIRHTATRYRAEYERNFERHPIIGVEVWRFASPPEIIEIDSFMGHVDFLLNWLEARVEWMDDFFNGRMPGHDPLWALVEYHTTQHRIDVTITHARHHFARMPINLQNRIMLTVEEMAALFGLTISHDTETGAVEFRGSGVTINHNAGDLFMTVNDEIVTFGVPASLYIQDYFYMPLRPVAEVLGHSLRWDFSNRTVIIE